MTALDARLLAALRGSPVHLPAGDLAVQLAVPFPAIQARLAELRDAGFDIEERPGLGYRLLGSPDRLIADDLRARLGECPLVREILVFEETESTNDLATRRGRPPDADASAGAGLRHRIAGCGFRCSSGQPCPSPSGRVSRPGPPSPSRPPSKTRSASAPPSSGPTTFRPTEKRSPASSRKAERTARASPLPWSASA